MHVLYERYNDMYRTYSKPMQCMYSIVSITTGICETLVECMCSVKTSPHEQFRNKYIKGPQKPLFIYCFKVYFLSHDGFLYFLF